MINPPDDRSLQQIAEEDPGAIVAMAKTLFQEDEVGPDQVLSVANSLLEEEEINLFRLMVDCPDATRRLFDIGAEEIQPLAERYDRMLESKR